MYSTVGRYISQGVYTVAGPFHPFGGAVDIIVVQQEDGTFKSSPWYVKFGKFQGVLKQREKVVDVAVNGNDVNFHMFLDTTGGAYFLKDADLENEVSILSPPSAASSGDDTVVNTLATQAAKADDDDVQAKVEIQESKEVAENSSSTRRSILGLLFRGYGKEQTLASPDSALERESSLERAEIISDLLDNSWGYGSGVKSRKSPQKLNSQEPLVISSLNSQNVATAKDSQAKASDSQMSLTGQTMGPEELVINKRKGELENPLSNSDAGAANRKSTYVEANTSEEQEEEVHTKLAVMKIDNVASTPHGENISDDELENPLSYSHIGSASGKSIYFEANTRVELSLCRHLLKDHMGREEAAEAFTSARVSLHEFKSSPASIIANDKLIIHVGGQYYPWSVAAPVVLGIFAFGQFIMPAIEGAIQVERPEPVAKSQAVVRTLGPTTSGGWKLWPFPSRRQKTPEQSITANPSVPKDPLKGATETALQTSFANDLLCQEGYYERPRKSKVRTIIPTSQMLAQMNLKEGSNRITFTFFTRMLGKQQLDARVYLWKWNTRIVISDVDGTITKSDVLGQVMPLVGKDWTQSGVARLFSSIKENGYELLFLSARAISQADLTRQFLFNVKQDGETLPNGPVVISPDGLFPSLYREVIRRTPHEFKIACLQDIRSLFPQDCNPFYAGFGNRDTDEISYLKVGIPKGKIFIINPRGEVAVNNRVDVKTYTSLHKLVNDMFPAKTYTAQEDYNSWNFWKLPLPDIEDELKSVSASTSKRT
ncbi:unnamed protein product [Sphagnum jensenii]|uniref:phosphatidate phosphatase n=1 Tax=Sphagnum jensenii TaxID=128206 RepID=A0ABP0VU34_9BRYO